MAFVKWLRCLKYMTIISIIISVFTCFEFIRNSNFFTWIYHYGEKFILYGAWVVCGITIYCLYRLSSLNNRYKMSSFFYLLYFACDLACILLLRIDFSEPMWDIMRLIYLTLSLAVLLFNIAVIYYEYTAHADVLAKVDTSLSRKLRKMFLIELIFGIILQEIIGFVLAGDNAGYTVIISLIDIIILSIRLDYLKRMVEILAVDT